MYFVRMVLIGAIVSYGYFKASTSVNIGILLMVSVWSFIENKGLIISFLTVAMKKVRKS